MSVLKWMYESEGYKQYGESSRAWKCPLCGHLQQGKDPAADCPYCHAPVRAFMEVGRGPASARRERRRTMARNPGPGSRALFSQYMR